MQLNKDALNHSDLWQKAGINMPSFSYDQVRKNTLEDPRWIHFGAGNLFRVYVARQYQQLLNQGKVDRGIIAVIPRNFELLQSLFIPYDHMSLAVLMNKDGSYDKTLVASIMDTLSTRVNGGDFARLSAYFENPGLQMISFTVTEKGYSLKNPDGSYITAVQNDLDRGPRAPEHLMTLTTALLYSRFLAGASPLAVVSMDNYSNNGDILKAAVLTVARYWVDKGLAEKSFLDYLNHSSKVSFPITMIDKITPGPNEKVLESLQKDGLQGMEIFRTGTTERAPFVNAEQCEYLVIEDTFPNGRPPLEEVGILMTDRKQVTGAETMKLTTCLNPLHTALAVFGCLLGFDRIWKEMEDPQLRRLVETIGIKEGLPVADSSGIINPAEFLQQVLEQRLTNPNLPDSPQRIASDSSQKVGIRFGHTLKAYQNRQDLNASELIGIPLAIAGWLRYLKGVDDQGQSYRCSPDPLLDSLIPLMDPFSWGIEKADLKAILGNTDIFPLDLYNAGVGQKIEGLFVEMMARPGAVRATLKKYLKE